MTNPKVSVVTITYNQERYIERSIRSVLNQHTSFSVEHLVADDCSTDSTIPILRRLAAENPSQLTLHLRTHNVGVLRNFCDAYHTASGEYVAFVEGDDYWIDPRKLQKQVELMDARPDCSLCFHPAVYVDELASPTGVIHPPSHQNEWTLEQVADANPVQTCSMMVRRSAVPMLPELFLGLRLGDWPLCILAAREGTLVCLPDAMSAYRVHHQGVWSGMAIAKRYSASAQMYFRLGCEYPDLRPLMETVLAKQAETLAMDALEGHQLRHTLTWRLASTIAWPWVTARSWLAPSASPVRDRDHA